MDSTLPGFLLPTFPLPPNGSVQEKENRNFHCLVEMLVGVVPKGLRSVFKKQWKDKGYQAVHAWDDTPASGLVFVKGGKLVLVSLADRAVEVSVQKDSPSVRTGEVDCTKLIQQGEEIFIKASLYKVKDMTAPVWNERHGKFQPPGQIKLDKNFLEENDSKATMFKWLPDPTIPPAERMIKKGQQEAKPIDNFVLKNYERGDVGEWDVTALSEALLDHTRKLLPLDSPLYAKVETIRKMRNSKLGHKSKPLLAEEDFQKCVADIVTFLEEGGVDDDSSLRHEVNRIMAIPSTDLPDLIARTSALYQRLPKEDLEEIKGILEAVGQKQDESNRMLVELLRRTDPQPPPQGDEGDI